MSEEKISARTGTTPEVGKGFYIGCLWTFVTFFIVQIIAWILVENNLTASRLGCKTLIGAVNILGSSRVGNDLTLGVIADCVQMVNTQTFGAHVISFLIALVAWFIIGVTPLIIMSMGKSRKDTNPTITE